MALEYLQTASSTGSSSAYTFSSQNLGDAADNRYIICIASVRQHYGSKTISSITVGGVSATIIDKNTNGYQSAALAIVAVPTGTTGDVVVTASSTADGVHIALWRVTELVSATPTDHASSVVADPTYDIDVPAGGFVVAGGTTSGGTTTTWTGVTKKYDGVISGLGTPTGASDTFSTKQTNLTVTMDYASPGTSAGCFASWGLEQPAGGGFQLWWGFCESWQRHDKLWRNNKLVLPKDLGFSY